MAELSAELPPSPLNIYLAYDYLSARQLGEILSTLERLYQTLAHTQFGADEFGWPFPLHVSHDMPYSWPFSAEMPPLCVDHVETGNSITFRFATVGEAANVQWSASQLEVILPRVTAPLVAIAAILTGGGWAYNEYLDMQSKQAQIELDRAHINADSAQVKLNEALTEQARSQAELNRTLSLDALQHARLNATLAEETEARTRRLTQKHTSQRQAPRNAGERGIHLDVHAQVQNFYALVNQPNITQAKVNGVDVRNLSDTGPQP